MSSIFETSAVNRAEKQANKQNNDTKTDYSHGRLRISVWRSDLSTGQ